MYLIAILYKCLFERCIHALLMLCGAFMYYSSGQYSGDHYNHITIFVIRALFIEHYPTLRFTSTTRDMKNREVLKNP